MVPQRPETKGFRCSANVIYPAFAFTSLPPHTATATPHFECMYIEEGGLQSTHQWQSEAGSNYSMTTTELSKAKVDESIQLDNS